MTTFTPTSIELVLESSRVFGMVVPRRFGYLKVPTNSAPNVTASLPSKNLFQYRQMVGTLFTFS